MPYLLTAPVMIMLGCILLVPSIYVVWMSLNSSSFGVESNWVGLDNYVRILSDPVFWRSTLNTLIVVNIVVYVEIVLAICLSLALARNVIGRAVIISIILMPYAVSEVAAIVMWRYMFEPDVGIVNYGLEWLGLGQLNWVVDRWHALFLVSLLTIWQSFPFTFLIIYAAVKNQPRETIEAAFVDGANRFQAFFNVTLPAIMPVVLVAVIFRYIFGLRLFSEVWLLTQGGPARLTEVMATYLYRYGFRYQDFGVAAATALIMLVVSLAIATVYVRWLYLRSSKIG
ncbi:MAG: sugar ABC transporter permease [Devosia sp. 67-54]|uniref:carbohydrate ABC transporter permease n=1 Tax=unclassified Devosia TaxID=196773 RepID=UPI00096853E4|nr:MULTISPECIES: sugar ABC transporter permease [unclassified Devosia]MBN9306754.1 sugar ABC transporter permease [Devosia sp.]OJX16012.1 MAG: sugar ABC transporter permease [Devosia sp. 67-54]